MGISSATKTLLSALLLFVAQWACAQTPIDITGTVRDASGETLVSAYIIVQETKQAVPTDAQGRFKIKARVGQTLQASYIGKRPQRVKVKGAVINFVLQDNLQIEEAVVTGYQKIKSRVFTGSAQSVKMADIKLEGVADLSRMLEGRVAGLSVQNISGTFGAAPRINIRGGASIMGNVQPLWVIDGVVYEDLVPLTIDQLSSGDAVTLISSAVAGLNASDIEDIQVLKDASATSIYGARALNGVIVVSTRSGKRNTPNKLSYTMEMSMRTVPSYGSFDLLNSQETMSIYREMNNKGYFSLHNTLYGRRSGVYHQMYRDITTYDPQTDQYLLPNTEAAKTAFLRERELANTDWFKHLFVNLPTHSHSITFMGGGAHSSTYASLGFYEDLGWTLADKVRRTTTNIKNTYFWSEKLRTTFTAQGNFRVQNAPGTLPQRKNTVVGSFERDFDINPFAYALGTSRTLRPFDAQGRREFYRNNWAPFNILNEYENNYMKTDVIDFKVQGDVSYWPSKELEIKGMLAIRQAFTSTHHAVHEGSNLIQAFRANETPYVAAQNIYLLRNREDQLLQPEVALTHGGIFNKTSTSLKSYMGRIAADYDKRWKSHNFRIFGFAELRQIDRTFDTFSGYGIQYDRGNQVYTNPRIFDKLISEGNQYFSLNNRTERGVTFSGNATYGYAGKYIFNTIVNYEGSNTAGKSARSRWLPTWNVGAKWNLDQENFLKDNPYFSRLALRVSYGLTAKMNEQAINSNVVFKNIILNRHHLDDREKALKILHLENRDLTWEKMYELNLGVDWALADNRVSATLDVYQRNSFDLIDLIRTSGVGGQYYKYANFGDMRTRGLEISIHTQNVKSTHFSWNTSITFSMMEQEITRLLNSPTTFDMVSGTGRGNVMGYPRGSLFSFNFQGLNFQGLPTFDFGLYPLNNDPKSNLSGADFQDAQYSKSYLIYHGSVDPKIMGGLSNTFKYKQFELSFFLTMQAGNKIRLNPTFDPRFGDLNVFSKNYYNRWLNPGDELRTTVPVLPSQDLIHLYGEENIERAYNTYNYSQMRVADGSFVRMKNISLGYTFAPHLLKAMKVNNASVKLNVTNPFLIYADSKLQGQDPEFYKSGGVSLPTPQQYTLTLGLQF